MTVQGAYSQKYATDLPTHLLEGHASCFY